MKCLCFMPLLIWAIGFCAIGEWCEHLRAIDKRKSAAEATAWLWVMGCLFWLVVGIILMIAEG